MKETYEKIFFSESAIPRACILSTKHCYMMPYIDPASDAPGVQKGPTPGDISSHILTMGKSYKNLLRNHEYRSFYILCVAMFNNLLYKSCYLCP